MSNLHNMDNFSHVVPPGFRFHPTDEELVDYYLRKKIASNNIDLDVIKDVDLYRIEPWDLQDLCKLVGSEEQNEWYFFSYKDKKYPTGTRTNRATKAGFWKATGRDKGIYSKHILVGMRKTLVFYKGRAPNGKKSDWIMHEYRLETNENNTAQEEGWVVCRVFKKPTTTIRRMDEQDSLCWFDDQVTLIPNFASTRRRIVHPYTSSTSYHLQLPAKSELDQLHYNLLQDHTFPQLESPANFQPTTQHSNINLLHDNNGEQDLQVADWRSLDKFVASQLSNNQEPLASECASISTSTCQVDLWK
ncbi:hypothetical protein QVD17_39905 [Tagetes erecta]|uniref:NAC domain-containing protein n=1 Tax=Tagetes erecta TaxID=13708 RepID=A0AAD8JRM0_TARER|nr:hypothetical protein QVD17_39905 [Tagetes erecta]